MPVRVVWLGDAGCQTGFARVTHSIGERLVRDYGHDIHVLATNYKGDPWPSTLDPGRQTPLRLYVPTLSNSNDTYGTGRIQEMLVSIQPDAVVMLNDPSIVMALLAKNDSDRERLLLQYRPILSYMPVDGYDLPHALTTILPQITNVVAMSRFGQDTFPGSKLVYHGVDTDLFRPAHVRPVTSSLGETVRTKSEARKALSNLMTAVSQRPVEYPRDAFLVVRVDSNSGRKDWPAMMKALAPVMARHRDIIVHCHTDPGKSSAGGVDLGAVSDRFPDIDQDRWMFPNMPPGRKWSDEDLVLLLCAADLVVDTSRGEGFGFGPAEALACEVPVVAQNVSAIPEVVGPGGILIDSRYRLTVPAGHDLCLPDVPAFTEAIEYLYGSAGARRDLGQKGREHIMASFSWDFAAARFDTFLRAMAAHVSKEPDG